MRKIREVLRLRLQCGLTQRQVAQSCKVGLGTVYEYTRRARDAGLSWPLPEGLTDEELDRRLFPPPPAIPSDQRPQPDWPALSRELAKKGVTLLLLWYEYRAAYPDGYGYSRFCELYSRWAGRADPRMRCVHKAGEKLFVDYAGQTMPIVDPKTGEVRQAQIFVATLGASSCTYVEATPSQMLPDWICSHVRALAHFGGVPEIVVPDNLKAGVTTPCYYDPDVNATYQEMAQHYGVAVIPTRVRAPRDKAKVESGVQQVERWVLAPLRNRRFFSFAELNAAMRPLVEQLNARAAPGLPASRLQLFQDLDQPALKPLPAQPYELALWSKARVHIDYHVQVERHFYSVPYRLIGQEVEARITPQIIELLHRGERVASHVRSFKNGGFTTLPEHMPPNHREWGDWNPERIARWAEKTGPATAQIAREIMASRPHPYQGYRACLGILRLGNEFGADRLEAACACALQIRALTYKSVKSILVHRLDRNAPTQAPTARPPIEHTNIRGALYYQSAPTERNLTDAASPDA
jgi:transposase